MSKHPRSADIAAALARFAGNAGPWQGIFYRATGMQYANSRDLLSGVGSSRIGGRWNPPGIRTVYGSLGPQTAMQESIANYIDNGIPPSQAMPLVFVGVNVKLQAILDIAGAEFSDSLRLRVADLVELDWQADQDAGHEALTQAIGRLAFDAGLEGLLVPSARDPAGRNIVVFPQRRRKGSAIRIENVRQLPKKKGG